MKATIIDDVLPQIDFEEYFMTQVYTGARKSKDRRTQVGCVAVIGKVPVAQGWNGPPQGWDDEDPRVHEQPTKDKLTIHAEMNLLANAAQNGESLKGATIFINFTIWNS